MTTTRSRRVGLLLSTFAGIVRLRPLLSASTGPVSTGRSLRRGRARSLPTEEEPVRVERKHELLAPKIDFELRPSAEKKADRLQRSGTEVPLDWVSVDVRVFDDQVAAGGDERCVCLEFSEDVIARVIGIENNHRPSPFRSLPHGGDDLG